MSGQHRAHRMRSTSLAAYRLLDRAKARRIVFVALDQHGTEGATADALQVDLNRGPNQVAPALTHMEADGLVFTTGETRPTRLNREANVYVTFRHVEIQAVLL